MGPFSSRCTAVQKTLTHVRRSDFLKRLTTVPSLFKALNKRDPRSMGAMFGVWNRTKIHDDISFVFEIFVNCVLLFKTSERLQEDLQHVTADTHLIFRQWVDSLSDEYRCFICHGQLNAISSSSSNPSSIDVTKFQEILSHVPYSHAIVDCSTDSQKNDQLIIIEINPFTRRAAAGRFSWVVDREILCDHYKLYGDVCVKCSSWAQ